MGFSAAWEAPRDRREHPEAATPIASSCRGVGGASRSSSHPPLFHRQPQGSESHQCVGQQAGGGVALRLGGRREGPPGREGRSAGQAGGSKYTKFTLNTDLHTPLVRTFPDS